MSIVTTDHVPYEPKPVTESMTPREYVELSCPQAIDGIDLFWTLFEFGPNAEGISTWQLKVETDKAPTERVARKLDAIIDTFNKTFANGYRGEDWDND